MVFAFMRFWDWFRHGLGLVQILKQFFDLTQFIMNTAGVFLTLIWVICKLYVGMDLPNDRRRRAGLDSSRRGPARQIDRSTARAWRQFVAADLQLLSDTVKYAFFGNNFSDPAIFTLWLISIVLLASRHPTNRFWQNRAHRSSHRICCRIRRVTRAAASLHSVYL